MNNNNLRQLRKALTRLGRKDSVPTYEETGICANIIRAERFTLAGTYPYYYETIQRWTHYSGATLFPIPCPEEYNMMYPGLFYSYHCPNKWAGEQGELRRKFCRFLVRELNKYCKKNGIKL